MSRTFDYRKAARQPPHELDCEEYNCWGVLYWVFIRYRFPSIPRENFPNNIPPRFPHSSSPTPTYIDSIRNADFRGSTRLSVSRYLLLFSCHIWHFIFASKSQWSYSRHLRKNYPSSVYNMHYQYYHTECYIRRMAPYFHIIVEMQCLECYTREIIIEKCQVYWITQSRYIEACTRISFRSRCACIMECTLHMGGLGYWFCVYPYVFISYAIALWSRFLFREVLRWKLLQ